MSTFDIPHGFKRVTKDEFFAALYADPRDIMPLAKPNFSTWETKTREVWGWTAPGYSNRRAHEDIYAIKA
ncbi:hypothetical protein LMG7141_00829 [Ralstonia condita]|uniref:Uncharacterized protein n=1 Tax=Ralstonia condita TaxID=3058600 RepID=A0ABM9J140_9RALS|nr:hypothetical protein [Ralstonia sp. LMG 7141]CAJ0779017.1 hypothetical protein LMG7141_00829 [Ralstonia sp. LMG 7141]